jgi:hypothetical protein
MNVAQTEPLHWWHLPLDHRAPAGGEMGVNGVEYKAGEFLPFYIPRIEMPQIPDDSHDEFMAFMKDSGIDYVQVKTSPEYFINHQRVHLDPAQVKKISPESMDVPIFASDDQYIIDGNHRWALHRHFKRPLTAIVFQAPFLTCMDTIFKFNKVFHVDGEK